jgi:hypothetical protein
MVFCNGVYIATYIVRLHIKITPCYYEGLRQWEIKAEISDLPISEDYNHEVLGYDTCSHFAREWRKLHKEELNDLHSSPNIMQAIKLERMRWVRHVAYMREGRGMYRVLVVKPRERDCWRDPGVVGRIILRWIFRKFDVWVWTGLSWLRRGIVGRHL